MKELILIRNDDFGIDAPFLIRKYQGPEVHNYFKQESKDTEIEGRSDIFHRIFLALRATVLEWRIRK